LNLWSQLGYSLLSNDENEKALKVFKECVAMSNSDPTYLFMCAKIQLNLNQPKECLNSLEMIYELIEQDENSFWLGNYHHISGLAYGELSQSDTSIDSKRKIQQIAIDHLLKANEKNKDDAKVLLHIALQYAENRDIKNAFKYVKLSLDLNSNVESWILLTLLFSSMKDYQKSIACVKTALSEYPSNLE
jgi:tetratricopeptide (TPR) repeat protein